MAGLREYNLLDQPLSFLAKNKLLINTLNAHSFNVSQHDIPFQEALKKSDVLLPDGISVVLARRWLTGQKIKKIAGADLFFYEMNRLQQFGGKCFFLGSSPGTLKKIKSKVEKEYPNVVMSSYSPPFKTEFSEEDNAAMIAAVNRFKPDVLFIGLTAPKQEKWAYEHFKQLDACHVCCIGAVFDFYAGTINRAPEWVIRIGMEWLYRLVKEPRRLWRRYFIGNQKFIWAIVNEKIHTSPKNPALHKYRQ